MKKIWCRFFHHWYLHPVTPEGPILWCMDCQKRIEGPHAEKMRNEFFEAIDRAIEDLT